MEPEILEWFRVDHSRTTRKLLVLGTCLVFAGAGLVGAAFLTHWTSFLLSLATLVGAGMLIFGLLLAFVGMAVVLARNEYLAVRADGLLFHTTTSDVLHAWGDIESISAGEEREWSIRRVDATTHAVTLPYSRVSPQELALHLEQLRKNAALGPLDAALVARLAIRAAHGRR